MQRNSDTVCACHTSTMLRLSRKIERQEKTTTNEGEEMKQNMTSNRYSLLWGWVVKAFDEQHDSLEECEQWEEAEALEKDFHAIASILANKWGHLREKEEATS